MPMLKQLHLHTVTTESTLSATVTTDVERPVHILFNDNDGAVQSHTVKKQTSQ